MPPVPGGPPQFSSQPWSYNSFNQPNFQDPMSQQQTPISTTLPPYNMSSRSMGYYPPPGQQPMMDSQQQHPQHPQHHHQHSGPSPSHQMPPNVYRGSQDMQNYAMPAEGDSLAMDPHQHQHSQHPHHQQHPQAEAGQSRFPRVNIPDVNTHAHNINTPSATPPYRTDDVDQQHSAYPSADPQTYTDHANYGSHSQATSPYGPIHSGGNTSAVDPSLPAPPYYPQHHQQQANTGMSGTGSRHSPESQMRNVSPSRMRGGSGGSGGDPLRPMSRGVKKTTPTSRVSPSLHMRNFPPNMIWNQPGQPPQMAPNTTLPMPHSQFPMQGHGMGPGGESPASDGPLYDQMQPQPIVPFEMKYGAPYGGYAPMPGSLSSPSPSPHGGPEDGMHNAYDPSMMITPTSHPPHAVHQPRSSRDQMPAEIWEQYKETIRQLYLEERRPLKEVMEEMSHRYDFRATPKMFKTRFALWGFGKNNTEDDMRRLICIKVRRDAEGKRTEFIRNGRVIDISTYLKRKGITEADLYDTEVPLELPPHIQCRTPSPPPANATVSPPPPMANEDGDYRQ